MWIKHTMLWLSSFLWSFIHVVWLFNFTFCFTRNLDFGFHFSFFIVNWSKEWYCEILKLNVEISFLTVRYWNWNLVIDLIIYTKKKPFVELWLESYTLGYCVYVHYPKVAVFLCECSSPEWCDPLFEIRIGLIWPLFEFQELKATLLQKSLDYNNRKSKKCLI